MRRLSHPIYSGKIIDPVHAVSMSGTDQINALPEKDDQYTTLKDNDKVDLEFELQVSDKKNVRYFLISSGYYHTLNLYPGKMHIAELLPFRKKGNFDKFSRYKYQQVNDELAKLIVKEKN